MTDASTDAPKPDDGEMTIEDFLKMLSSGRRGGGGGGGSGCGRPGCENCGPAAEERNRARRLTQLRDIYLNFLAKNVDTTAFTVMATTESSWVGRFATALAETLDEVQTFKNNWGTFSDAEKNVIRDSFPTEQSINEFIALYGSLAMQLNAVVSTLKLIKLLHPPTSTLSAADAAAADDDTDEDSSDAKMQDDDDKITSK